MKMKTSEALRELAWLTEQRPETVYLLCSTPYRAMFDPHPCDPPEGTVTRTTVHVSRDEFVVMMCFEACVAEDLGD